MRDEHGVSSLTLLFTDVAQEDEDLYRFVVEGAADVLGVPLGAVRDLAERALALPPVWRPDLKVRRLRELEELAREAEARLPGLAWITHGRDVWDVFLAERFLGNSRVNPCSRILKREAAERRVKARYGPEEAVVYLGIDWTEARRHRAARARWLPYRVESPLCEEPGDPDPKGTAKGLLREAGIELPRLYRQGFNHNNCAGCCVKAGKGQWAHLLSTNPKLYRYQEERERELREHLGKDVTILREQRDGVRRRITLRQLRERLEAGGRPRGHKNPQPDGGGTDEEAAAVGDPGGGAG